MSLRSNPVHSIVEYMYPPESEGHRCGYCKSPASNFSHGMWAHTISPENYELLINIGWRRSGSYLYKPMNEKVCCPMYTIRNLSTSVEISRSQRKVLKKFRKYLADGVRKKADEDKIDTSTEGLLEIQKVPEKRRALGVNEIKSTVTAQSIATNATPSSTTTTTASTQQAKKLHPLKKKLIRRERKRQKLLAKGEDPDAFFRRNDRNRVTELQNFFAEQEGDKVKFTTKLVRVDSEEFLGHFDAEHALYQKYQMHTHGDTEKDCRASQFRRFLCDNPFNQEDDHSFPQGTFHQHYYVNSHLIAVGVVDILPHCVSSVYFFYDPEYSFLSPGTLGALHEISFVNQLNKTNPQIQYYYLGFYIHSCVKMRYKRNFRPCDLVCPITREWVRFDERVVRLLDANKYCCLHENAETGRDNNNDDIHEVLLLYHRRVYEYSAFPHKSDQREELQSYVNLVSARVASNMLLYRSSK